MKLAIVGKGALGLLYGAIAQDHLGRDQVCFVMDDARLERHSGDTYTINGMPFEANDVPVSRCEPAEVVFLAVKSTCLDDALDVASALIGPDTVVVPLLNGITSESKTAQRIGWERTVACVAYGMDAARFGTRLEYTKAGELVLGRLSDDTPLSAVDKAAALLDEAGIPYSVEYDIEHRQWAKFMANTGVNQTSAAFGITYRQLFEDRTSEAFRTFIGAMREVLAVANVEGVALTEADMNAYIDVLLSLDPDSMPSMAQDRVNKNPSEVDEFSGEIMRRADKHGLCVPCNQYLNDRIRAIEAHY